MTDELKDLERRLKTLMSELHNFQENAKYLIPSAGEIPDMQGIEVYGEAVPLNGIIGGDHIVYVPFRQRYDLDARIRRARATGKKDVAQKLGRLKDKAGILLSDASGHQVTDALLTAMLHQAFLIGVHYELEMCGEVTTSLFEAINTRVYKSSGIEKYVTMIYGEISERGVFRFISSGHPLPVIFSNKYNKLVDISKDRLTTFTPIGFMPSEKDPDIKHSESWVGYKEEYAVNELNLMGSGDILLLYTDGLSDHFMNAERYFPDRLEHKLREVKELSAKEIFQRVLEDVLDFGEPADDITYVVIKKL